MERGFRSICLMCYIPMRPTLNHGHVLGLVVRRRAVDLRKVGNESGHQAYQEPHSLMTSL